MSREDQLERKLDSEQWAHRYWHKAFCISMFFHGFISGPLVVIVIVRLIQALLR